MLQRAITVRIQENVYEVKFPNVGQMIDIESRKATLSSGQYKSMVSAGNRLSNMALDYIDMVSTFGVLIPNFIKDMTVDIFTLDLEKGRELIKVYKKEVLPFITEWMNTLEKEDEKESEEVGK